MEESQDALRQLEAHDVTAQAAAVAAALHRLGEPIHRAAREAEIVLDPARAVDADSSTSSSARTARGAAPAPQQAAVPCSGALAPELDQALTASLVSTPGVPGAPQRHHHSAPAEQHHQQEQELVTLAAHVLGLGTGHHPAVAHQEPRAASPPQGPSAAPGAFGPWGSGQLRDDVDEVAAQMVSRGAAPHAAMHVVPSPQQAAAGRAASPSPPQTPSTPHPAAAALLNTSALPGAWRQPSSSSSAPVTPISPVLRAGAAPAPPFAPPCPRAGLTAESVMTLQAGATGPPWRRAPSAPASEAGSGVSTRPSRAGTPPPAPLRLGLAPRAGTSRTGLSALPGAAAGFSSASSQRSGASSGVSSPPLLQGGGAARCATGL